MKTLPALLTYSLLTFVAPTLLFAQQNEGWENPFGIPGTDGEVTVISKANGIVLIGGKFTHVGAIPANGIALWNGKEWQPLGNNNTNGVNGTVYAIAVKGDEIYVGGSFTIAGGIPAMNIAIWNQATKQWSNMKEGVRGATFPFVATLSVHNDQVYVGGLFTQAGGALASNVAVWNGDNWSRVGTGTNNAVLSMIIDDGILYAGGRFTTAGGVDAKKIAAWDIASQEWSSLGIGINGDEVNTIITNDTALFIGGDFSTAGSIPAKNLAVWQRSSGKWDSIASMQWSVRTLAFQDQDLLVGGTGLTRVRNGKEILVDSSVWMLKSVDGQPTVNRIQIGANGAVLIGGNFSEIYSARYKPRVDSPSIVARNFFAFHKDSVVPYMNTVNGPVYSLHAQDDRLFVGGFFTYAGTKVTQILAAWNVIDWQWQHFSLTSGTKYSNSRVESIAVVNDTAYASRAGELWRSNGKSEMRNLTREKKINGGILLAHNNTLYLANGGFNSGVYSVSNDTALQVAPRPVGPQDQVYIYSALINKQDIYVGGYFSSDTSGAKIVNSLRRWDGNVQQWFSVGGYIKGTVSAIAMDSAGRIVIGGILNNAGITPVQNIAIWDPSTAEWSDMDGGANGTVASIIVHKNNIYVAGAFSEIGGIKANRIARWDGKQWHPLGLGIEGGSGVYTLAIDDSSYLYAGGDFSRAGGVKAYNLARWNTTLKSSAVKTPEPTGQILEVSAIYYLAPQRVVISLATPLIGEAAIEVFTPIGQKIGEFSCQPSSTPYQLSFDASSLPAGCYFCRITGNGSVTTERLMITR